MTKIEVAIEKLIEAQRRNEEKYANIEASTKKLAETQRRIELKVEKMIETQNKTETGIRSFETTIGEIDIRGGIMRFSKVTEKILAYLGFQTERFIVRDRGEIVYLEEVGLDGVGQNSNIFVIEIKSAN